MTGQPSAKPTTVTDLNTLIAALRNAAVGRDAITVTCTDDEGKPLVSVRMETRHMFTPSPRVDGARPERMAPVHTLGRRSTDPRADGGTAVYGVRGGPLPPVMDAPGPLADLPHMRASSNDLCRGEWTGP